MVVRFLKTIIILMFLFPLSLVAQEQNKPLSPEIQNFINRMSLQHHFDRKYLKYLFTHTAFLPVSIHSMNHPAEKKPWDYYQRFFISQERINQGVLYWRTHHKILNEIYQKYGVDPSIVVAIIGIESFYGHQEGKFSEMGSLATLAFNYPGRGKFFKRELEQYLLLTRDQHLSPLELKGSYAGALGIPQFMPSSYRTFAVNFDHTNRVDLLHNHHDAIASIANYLKNNGWKNNEPIATPAKTPFWFSQKWLSTSAKPKWALADLMRHQIKPTTSLPDNLSTALIALEKTRSKEYWLVFPNFHVIMSYNTNIPYAMAVYQLSEAIREAYERSA